MGSGLESQHLAGRRRADRVLTEYAPEMAGTYLFYDYETDGADAIHSRPYQFACIRTDDKLNPVEGPEGEGLTLWCRPPDDRLPSPEAVLVTGITPQQACAEGRTEAAFFGEIHRLLNTPGTTSLGWNSMRFDDPVSRFGFWRNFLDPYAHTWQDNCRTWDLIDVMRACYAFRPEGFQWPAYVDEAFHESRMPLAPHDGPPAFKLDMLAPANGIEHSDAHDALADVRATIAIARLIQQHQQGVWETAARTIETRIAKQILTSKTAFLHASSRIPNAHGCGSLMFVVGQNPVNDKEYIAWDLRHDPTELLKADADTIQSRTFCKKEDLPPGVERFALKGIKTNHAPFLLESSPPLMESIDTSRIDLDLDACRRHFVMLRDAEASLKDRISEAWIRDFPPANDVDDQLYDGAFIKGRERARCTAVTTTPPDELRSLERGFEDPRLSHLLLHYRARNHPETLDETEQRRWTDRCAERLKHPPGRDDLPWTAWTMHLQELMNDPDRTSEERDLLRSTLDWGSEVAARAGIDAATTSG